jgi:hypothetical protein
VGGEREREGERKLEKGRKSMRERDRDRVRQHQRPTVTAAHGSPERPRCKAPIDYLRGVTYCSTLFHPSSGLEEIQAPIEEEGDQRGHGR